MYLISLRKARGFLLKSLLQHGEISSKVQMQLEKIRANNDVINLMMETVTETSVYFSHLTLLLARQEYIKIEGNEQTKKDEWIQKKYDFQCFLMF